MGQGCPAPAGPSLTDPLPSLGSAAAKKGLGPSVLSDADTCVRPATSRGEAGGVQGGGLAPVGKFGKRAAENVTEIQLWVTQTAMISRTGGGQLSTTGASSLCLSSVPKGRSQGPRVRDPRARGGLAPSPLETSNQRPGLWERPRAPETGASAGGNPAGRWPRPAPGPAQAPPRAPPRPRALTPLDELLRLLPDARVAQKTPLALLADLALQVVFFWDLQQQKHQN